MFRKFCRKSSSNCCPAIFGARERNDLSGVNEAVNDPLFLFSFAVHEPVKTVQPVVASNLPFSWKRIRAELPWPGSSGMNPLSLWKPTRFHTGPARDVMLGIF